MTIDDDTTLPKMSGSDYALTQRHLATRKMKSSATSLRQYGNLQKDLLSLNTLVSDRRAGIQLYLTLFTLGILLQLCLGSSLSEVFIMIGSRCSSASILTLLGAVLFIPKTGPTKT